MTEKDTTEAAIQFPNPLSLPTVLEDCWKSLERSASDRNSGWRLPILATAGGFKMRQRIVVLRKVVSADRSVFAHTDARSPKVDAIQQNSHISWLFYDHTTMVQLQVEGTARIHTTDDVADEVWAAESESSLRGYLAPYPPGTIRNSSEFNLPKSVLGRIPDRSELAAARNNFAVISCEVQSIEWLYLRREGNLRALFEYSGDDVKTDWLAP